VDSEDLIKLLKIICICIWMEEYSEGFFNIANCARYSTIWLIYLENWSHLRENL